MRREAASYNWESLESDDIDTYASNITETLITLSKKHIPNKIVTIRQTDPPWMHNEIRKYIRKRKRAYDRAKKSNNIEHWNKYKTLRNKTTHLLRNAKTDYTKQLSEKIKGENLKTTDYWKILKQFIKPTVNSKIKILNDNGTILTSDTEKANLLNQFFQSQSSLDDKNKSLPNFHVHQNINKLDTINITYDEVRDTLKTLNVGKASGPDNINNRILKELSEELSVPLCHLFRKSLTACKVPSQWKLANVCAVYKKGDPSIVSNYRPISLLSTISKSLEKIIHKHIFNFFVANNTITSLQSGFVPNDSTTNQLVSIYNTFCKALDDGKEVRAVFCDISKAFDRVWHKGLIFKLQSAGINGGLLNWFSDYLSDRKQKVVLPGGSSQTVFISAGVPQGSILGPLLFLIYINDIVLDINSYIRLFADDTSLYIIVDNPLHAAVTLNSDLKKITEWANGWLVDFNPSKTESVIISRKVNKPIHPPLTMNGVQINEVTSHKHLGVTFSNDGNWHSHIQNITKKAWQRIYIMRSLKFILDRKSLETIYLSFIRPLLEYSDVVWDNITQQDEFELEKIQLEACRIITGTTKLVSISNLYEDTCIQPLKVRRYKHKQILLYKMFNNLSPHYLSSLVPDTVGESSDYNLRNADNTRNIFCHTQLYSHSFLPSSIKDWNNLPVNYRNSPSISIFKSRLNEDVQSVPSHYYVGERKYQIIHTRLRTHCSSLKEHLFSKNIIESPLCECGDIENTSHYFFSCPRYQDERNVLLNNLSEITTVTLNVLLYGDNSIADDLNEAIVLHIHSYLHRTKRFEM
jgi:hypothetical protein